MTVCNLCVFQKWKMENSPWKRFARWFSHNICHGKDLLVFSVEFCESLWTSFFPEFEPKQILACPPPFYVNEKIWCKRESEPPGDVEGLSQFASIRFTALFKLTLCYALFNLPSRWIVSVKRFQMIFEREMIVWQKGVNWFCDI